MEDHLRVLHVEVVQGALLRRLLTALILARSFLEASFETRVALLLDAFRGHLRGVVLALLLERLEVLRRPEAGRLPRDEAARLQGFDVVASGEPF